MKPIIIAVQDDVLKQLEAEIHACITETKQKAEFVKKIMDDCAEAADKRKTVIWDRIKIRLKELDLLPELDQSGSYLALKHGVIGVEKKRNAPIDFLEGLLS